MDGKKKKQLSGAQKRKKKKEKEEAMKEALADMERLKLGPTKLWTGLVTHHKHVFCLACDSEIEWDRSFVLFKGEQWESGCACVRWGKRIGIMCGCLRMFIHFDAGIGVE